MSNCGKGDRNRTSDHQRYRKNYINIFGNRCPLCQGTGIRKRSYKGHIETGICSACKGTGLTKLEINNKKETNNMGL